MPNGKQIGYGIKKCRERQIFIPPGGTEQKQNRAWAFVSRVTVELRKEKKDDGQRSGEWFSISPNFFSPNMNP